MASPQEFGLGAHWQLRLDGSDDVIAQGQPDDHITLPPLASGVYALTATASGRTEIITVLAAPKQLPSLKALTGTSKLWGLNLALYGLQSNRNTGLGDFEDLAQAAEIAGVQGAGFIGINPLHTMGHCDVNAISPYSPSHRGFLNTEYIALDRIPGLKTAQDLSDFGDIKLATSVQYQAHKAAHHRSLNASYQRYVDAAPKPAKSEFATFKTKGGSELQDCARVESSIAIHSTKSDDGTTL